jgi:hypothetical protein
MGGDWTPLLWLIVLFTPLLSVKRWLSRHLQGVGLLFFGNHEGATALHYIVLLPGVVLHEFSHWLAAKLVGVRTAGISLMPQVKRGGTVRLGAVKVGKSDPLRESWIGIAPFIGGTVAILLLASWQFGVELQPVLSLELVLHTVASSLRAPDALLWLYLVFSISNAMLPSESDRQPWLSALIFLGVVAAIVYISGASVRIPVQVKEWVLTGATYLAFTFGLVLAVDIPVVFLLMVIERLGGILLGRHVQY